MLCAIWCYLHNLRNVKNTHGGVSLLVKLQASNCNFIKSNTLPWVLFAFFKLGKWYRIFSYFEFWIIRRSIFLKKTLMAVYAAKTDSQLQVILISSTPTELITTTTCISSICELIPSDCSISADFFILIKVKIYQKKQKLH